MHGIVRSLANDHFSCLCSPLLEPLWPMPMISFLVSPSCVSCVSCELWVTRSLRYSRIVSSVVDARDRAAAAEPREHLGDTMHLLRELDDNSPRFLCGESAWTQQSARFRVLLRPSSGSADSFADVR